MTAGSARQPLIDALKVVASQLIVLHHLAFYGPMVDHAEPLMPGLFDWFAEHARLAVQVFLVVGGYLAAQRFAGPDRMPSATSLGGRLVERYLRLALPLVLALGVAIAAAALARGWMQDESVPAPPEPVQVLAHLMLAQDLLGQEALSAGIWYVSIDFQLYAVLLLLLAAAAAAERWLRGPREGFRTKRSPTDGVGRAVPWLLATAVAASALYFNRRPEWDVAAPYFMAAYGLGALAAWAARGGRSARAAWWSAVALVGLALAIDGRERLLLALVVALGLWARQRVTVSAILGLGSGTVPRSWRVGLRAGVTRLARSSYAMFLVHFPVVLVVNAIFTAWVPPRPWPQFAGLLLAWAASIAAGELFHRWGERPITRWLSRLRDEPAWPGPGSAA